MMIQSKETKNNLITRSLCDTGKQQVEVYEKIQPL